MVSERVGQATLRSSARTSCMNWRLRGALSLTWACAWRVGASRVCGRARRRRRPRPALQHALLFSVHGHDGTPSVDVRSVRDDDWSRAGGTRTPNPRFWRPVLYQLSYCPRGELSRAARIANGPESDTNSRRPGRDRPARPPRRPPSAGERRAARRAPAGEHDGAAGAGRGGRRDATDVGHPAAAEQRAHGPALAGLLEAGEDRRPAGPGPGRAPRCAGPAGPAAACGTAPARPGSAGTARRGAGLAPSSSDRAVGRRDQQVGDRRHTARALRRRRSAAWRPVGRRPIGAGTDRSSRSLRRARCRRTLAADSEMPSSAAMASWGRS